jgi:ferric-dicitrate binding protein FerR (iron transport regulator)
VDASQLAEVERWRTADPANARELERLRQVWEHGAEGLSLPEVDVDRAWARAQQRMDGSHGTVRAFPMTPLRWLAAAAVAEADPVHATLEDSSRVVLSPGTRMKARLGDQRRVELHGAAYFEVTKDAAHPFVVSTSELTVTVLGTAFEVVAYDSAARMEVRVREGRVRVVAGSDTAVLVAGDQVGFDRSKRVLERDTTGPVEHWGDRILQFDQAPMQMVLRQVRERYGVEVTLADEAIARCALTATFENEPVEVVLQVIAETFGLELRTVASGRYLFTGDGC